MELVRHAHSLTFHLIHLHQVNASLVRLLTVSFATKIQQISARCVSAAILYQEIIVFNQVIIIAILIHMENVLFVLHILL